MRAPPGVAVQAPGTPHKLRRGCSISTTAAAANAYEEKKSNNGPSMLNACYNIRGDGGDHHGEFSRSCTEHWVGKRLDHIECDRPTKLFFQPNGNFIFSYLHPSLSDRPPGDY